MFGRVLLPFYLIPRWRHRLAKRRHLHLPREGLCRLLVQPPAVWHPWPVHQARGLPRPPGPEVDRQQVGGLQRPVGRAEVPPGPHVQVRGALPIVTLQRHCDSECDGLIIKYQLKEMLLWEKWQINIVVVYWQYMSNGILTKNMTKLLCCCVLFSWQVSWNIRRTNIIKLVSEPALVACSSGKWLITLPALSRL